jgi:TonB-linked SusC/RagA family outer membrane protein
MRRLLLIMLGMLIMSFHVLAQNRTVTGTVTDDKGNPVPNASVVVKGTKNGTTTNSNGSFSLNVPANAHYLVVSSIGLDAKEVALTNSGAYNVSLITSANGLQEVVVVGYGTRTVRENTGSIGKVSGEKIANEPVASLDQALAGKTAGVQISLGSGVLADRTAIRVRGINSISSSSQPLVVVDGVPQVTVTNLNGFNGGNGTRFDPLALIDPNDIESIDVLKDAGAASIYGSRASNGVIIITTKKGKKGSVKVNFESKVGWSQASKLPSLLNGDQFETIMNEKVANNPNTAAAGAVAKDSDINGDGKPDRTNWLDYAYRQALTTDNYISFSGGADKISVFGSARYLKQEGITLGNKLTSGQTRLNLDFTPKPWFKSGVQIAYTKTLNNGVLTDGYIAGAGISGWQAPPNVAAYNPNGPLGYNLTAAGLLGNGSNVTSINGGTILPSASYYYNILPTIKLQRNDNTADEIRANIYGEITPYKGLKLTSKFGIQNLSNFEDQFNSPYIAGLGTPYNGLVQDQRQEWQQWVWQNYLNFDRTFAVNHRVSFIAGTEYQRNKYQYLYVGASNFTDPFFTQIIDGAHTNTFPGQTSILDLTGGNVSGNGLISYFGRLSYSFSGKYFVEGSIRRDGFSGFGSKYQFGTFPSVSLGWEATKEKFLQDISWLNFLKVRGSYGEVGNSRGVGDYASLTLFTGAAYTSLNGLGISQAGNAALRWETAKKLNIGFDATILKDKINVTADYFDNNINNLILSAPVLYTTGIPGASITSNIGGMENKGVELTISSTPYKNKDFSWSTSVNFTRIWNKVTGLVPANNNADIVSGVNVASVGKELGTFYLPRWAGVDPQTGNPMWYAADGSIKRYNFGASVANLWTDEKGNPVKALSSADYAYAGKSGLPNFYGGWDNNFTYKSFDLNINIVYQGGNYIYNSTKAGMLTNFFSNNVTDILNRWQKAGDVTNVPKVYLLDNTANGSSTRFLEKGDFVRFRTITLGYNLDKSILTRIGFDNIRVYVQAYNPFIITKYSGLDPDVSTSGTTQSNIALGVDSRATPQVRTYTLGVNVNF